MDKVTGKLTIWCTTQAPHAHRTLYALVAGLPEHKIRVISPDIGGGFGNKVGIYPGYVLTVVGSIVTGKPVKWMEDRSENLMSTSFARDYHMHGEIAATRDGQDHRPAGQGPRRPRRVQRHGAADEVPGRVLPHLHRLLRPPGGPLRGHRRLHQQGPGGRGLRLLVPGHRGGVPRRADGRLPGRRAQMDPAELRMKNLLRPEQFPYTCKTGWVYDSGDYPRALRLAMEHRRLRRAPRRAAGREARARVS